MNILNTNWSVEWRCKMSDTHEIEVYVRFCDTDALGHVNNTSYFQYFEEARTKFFRVVYPSRTPAFSFILASITCDYKSQAFAEQTLLVRTHVKKVGNKSFTVNHILSNPETGMIIAESDAVIVCFNYTNQETMPIPNHLRDNLEQHLVAL